VTALVLKAINKSRPIIHCAGRHVRGSITEDLSAAGYNARRDLYYQSEAVTDLPAIDYAALTHIAFYSPLAAKTFQSFASQDLLGQVSLDIHKAVFISISRATDAALGGLHGDRPVQRHIADAPNEAAMIKTI